MSHNIQNYKSIYFSDYRNFNPNSKGFTLAFPDKEIDLFNLIKPLSSFEMRKLLEIETFKDLNKKALKNDISLNKFCIKKIKSDFKKLKADFSILDLDPIHTTFKGGKSLPLQSWYPYMEGYSPDFVKYIIDNFLNKKIKKIYDPFSGVGTTPLVTSSLGYNSIYSEINPLLQFITNIKIKVRNYENKKLLFNKLNDIINHLEQEIESKKPNLRLAQAYGNVFGESKYFSGNILKNILKTKTYINDLKYINPLLADIVTTAILSSLVQSSLLKRQGDLRFKTKKELQNTKNNNYFKNLKLNLYKIRNDLNKINIYESPYMITEDARNIGKLPFLGIDAIITSPPYLNGTNYIRNTKIELWFLGYLNSKDDLSKYRRLTVTAGINDVSFEVKKKIENKQLKKLLKTITEKAYDKRIPKMINDYFADMALVFKELKKQLKNNAFTAIDLGDSIYSGIHVKTDEILTSILENLGYKLNKNITLRKRISNNGQELKQVLLLFNVRTNKIKSDNNKFLWKRLWLNFKKDLPHHTTEMAKRNWGDKLHSLCSYQGKLKPAIANQLVKTFVPENGSVLDIFAGVGTIPLEAALQGKKSYSFEISPVAYIISRAKLSEINQDLCFKYVENLERYILNNNLSKTEEDNAKEFGYNKNLKEYFHPKTLKEIILARKYFTENKNDNAPEKDFIFASLLHILHGNRPYALSRRSHGITPYSPTGKFEYKNLIEKLKEKINRMLDCINREVFKEGIIYFQDTTKSWPIEIQDLDAIITSPPFFDSTRFYLINWMRLWFAGWDDTHFKTEPINFIDELQKEDLSIYDNIFVQARERLKKDGIFVMHLGKSNKCNMAKVLAQKAKKWFRVLDIFNESVVHCESHGIKDKGTVTSHQYLILG